jgi:predicted ATP-grasp superfamily ATP-dependent carboligase
VRDGRLYLLEANPRFNLWHHAGAVAGVNLPALVYADLVSPGSARPEARPLRPGVRWMWAIADLQQCRSTGELDALRWLREFAGAHVVEDLCWTDPLPGVARLVGRLRPRATKNAENPAAAAVAAQG